MVPLELGVIVGLVVALVAILGSNAMEGGSVGSLISPSAVFLILGGTIGATAMSVGLGNFFRVPSLLGELLRRPGGDLPQAIDKLVGLAQKARREGLLALEEDIRTISDELLAQGLQMVVDGTDSEVVEAVLVTKAELARKRFLTGAAIFETAGGYAPTMGIIGTVMGLIHVLSNLENPNELGSAIAMAFLATLWGIATANVFWLPVANKLKDNGRLLGEYQQMIIEGVLSIQKGDSPAMVREKLRAFLPGSKRKEKKREEAEAAPGPSPAAQPGESGA